VLERTALDFGQKGRDFWKGPERVRAWKQGVKTGPQRRAVAPVWRASF
jgi:hypothetical protein